MPLFPSLPDSAATSDIWRRFPAKVRDLAKLNEAVTRAPSAFSPGERELLAACVSAANACRYCYGVHSETARALGIDEAVFSALADDPAAAPVDERLKPVLAYVRKLTLTPAKMTQADADAVFAAGWDEDALHDAVLVCAMFNFMNRVVEGHGVLLEQKALKRRGLVIAKEVYDRPGKTEPVPENTDIN
jgi:uncharacterized peroxidase-related enzyme